MFIWVNGDYIAWFISETWYYISSVSTQDEYIFSLQKIYSGDPRLIVTPHLVTMGG